MGEILAYVGTCGRHVDAPPHQLEKLWISAKNVREKEVGSVDIGHLLFTVCAPANLPGQMPSFPQKNHELVALKIDTP